jgi:hypothetical protein
VWLSGAQTARIPKNSRAGKQGGRLPVLLGENRRELGEIEAFWNERSRFPEGARLPRPLPSSRVVYNAAAAPKARSASRGRHTRKSPPTHAYGNSSACTHGICTCRSRVECVCMYVCAVALSTRERGASEKPTPVAYEQRETHTMRVLHARLGEYNARKHE